MTRATACTSRIRKSIACWCSTTRAARSFIRSGSAARSTATSIFPNLALDKQGQLYVVDTGNWRVQIFSPDFKFVDTFGRQGVQFGDFLRPKGIAIDSYGNVYVVDSDFNNFQVFDSKRRLLMFIGSQGVFPGQFRVPAGIFVDADNNVYVTDQDNKRVVVFKLLDGAVQEPDPGTAVARQQPTKKLSPNAAALSGSQAGK